MKVFQELSFHPREENHPWLTKQLIQPIHALYKAGDFPKIKIILYKHYWNKTVSKLRLTNQASVFQKINPKHPNKFHKAIINIHTGHQTPTSQSYPVMTSLHKLLSKLQQVQYVLRCSIFHSNQEVFHSNGERSLCYPNSQRPSTYNP